MSGPLALQPTIPHLTRSSLHRCFQRHGISRLPDVEGDKPRRKAFKKYHVGYVHIDFAEVRTEEGKLYLFVAIDRTSKVCYAELHEQAKRAPAAGFLRAVIEAFPYDLHTVLTDNGIQFTHRAQDRYAFRHLSDRVCAGHGIEHRLTKIGHPWTNGQVERMNRTLKEATVKQYHSGSHEQLREHLSAFLLAYNYAKRLKTLRGLTPYEFVCREWQREPDRFYRDPTQDTLEPYTYSPRHAVRHTGCRHTSLGPSHRPGKRPGVPNSAAPRLWSAAAKTGRAGHDTCRCRSRRDRVPSPSQRCCRAVSF